MTKYTDRTPPQCPYCDSSDVLVNPSNFEEGKPKSIYSDFTCIDCDSDFNVKDIKIGVEK